MSSKKIQIHLVLPSGQRRDFTIVPGTNWRAELNAQLQDQYPRSENVTLVEEWSQQKLASGKVLRTNVMFEIRKNYFVLGHLVASLPPDN
ncbi:MAG: hypothetical protein KDI38_03845 [Calditrichaeota bacterium]|nr:hypothetical protein [Calditrichota bacterium]MCB0302891.1 hypothetical protein [Calditrichota bacterium]MCB0314319.1 hypothetical protein [Calditrichota bacterium]MCB9088025.1 hypothetical protein [Calditrichia bacterium]